MYQREFDRLLQQGLPRAVLLYGENDYQIERYIALYKERLDAGESMLAMYHDEYDFDRAREYLSQSSLFGGHNFLLLRRDKKLPKKELDTLVGLCARNEGNHFLFDFRGEARDAKGMHASFSEKHGGVWVRLFPPNPREATAQLRTLARKLVEIDDYALGHLCSLLEGNMALCANELRKLAILDRPIGSKEIDDLVYSTAPLAVERLLHDLFARKPITETLTRLLELGEDEFSILRASQFFVQQLFLFQAHIKIHGHPDSAAILGYKLPRHVEEEKAALALRVRSSTLLKLYEHLIQSEVRMKKSHPEQRETLLYGVMIGMQGLLRKQV